MPQNEYLKNQLLKRFIASALPTLRKRKPSTKKSRKPSDMDNPSNDPAPNIEALAKDVAAREFERTAITLVRPCGVQSRQRPRGIRVSR